MYSWCDTLYGSSSVQHEIFCRKVDLCSNSLIKIKEYIKNISNWNSKQFQKQMELNKKMKLNIASINGHDKDDHDRIESCEYGKIEEEIGTCWCKLSDYIVTQHKLSKQTIYDNEDNPQSSHENPPPPRENQLFGNSKFPNGVFK